MDELCFCVLVIVVLAEAYTSNQVVAPVARRDAALYEACSISEDCWGYGAFCSDRNHTCQCSDGYLADRSTRRCLGGVNQRCQYDEHCVSGAFCLHQQTCQCKDTHPLKSDTGMECSSASLGKGARMEMAMAHSVILLLIVVCSSI